MMTHMITLVDDDKNILTSVKIALAAEGFQVSTFFDSEEALEYLLLTPPDLAILDIKMPRMTGMELLKKLRQKHDTPVIFLTSKDDEIDEMLGLRCGADDYITKPFSQRLLIERIRTILRRHKNKNQNQNISQEIDEQTCVRKGHLVLDSSRHICLWKDERVDLTVTEFLILSSLSRHSGHVKTRDQLMDAAYGEYIYVDDRTIDSHIKRLRRKFRNIDKSFEEIETLYGVGYRYRDTNIN